MKLNITKLLAWTFMAGIGGLAGYFAFKRKKRQFTYQGKVVLVTGGARGLGYIMARQLVEEGAKVIICARDADQLDKAYVLLRNHGEVTYPYVCDITEKENIVQLAYFIKKRFGRLDVLINNTGTITINPIEQLPLNNYKKFIESHLWGPMQLVRVLIPLLSKSREAKIVNIFSVGGKISLAKSQPYDVNEIVHAVFYDNISRVITGKNIKLTAIYPEFKDQDLPVNLKLKGHSEQELAWSKFNESRPLISLYAENVGKQILKTAQIGKKTLTLPFPRELARIVNNINTELNLTLCQLVDHLVPHDSGSSSIISAPQNATVHQKKTRLNND